MNARKKAEAEEHVRKAEKYLKTSLMKWTPDHDGAGDEFSKAATCFKVAGEPTAALDALNRACECYKECRSLYQAAKMLEQSVLICRDTPGRFSDIASLAERGALLYRQHGSPESAAQLLEKAAKILESKDSEAALDLYEKAAETIMVEDRPKQAAEYLHKVGRLQVKAGALDKAAKTLEETVKLLQESGSTATVGRIVSGLVLVELAREDVVAASKAFNAWGGYCDGDQSAALNTLIQAFNDEDGDLAKRGLASGAVMNLDVEFTRLAKTIPLPAESGNLEAAAAELGARRTAEAIEKQSHSFGVDAVAPAQVGATKLQREEEVKSDLAQQEAESEPPQDDEDDDEGGLC